MKLVLLTLSTFALCTACSPGNNSKLKDPVTPTAVKENSVDAGGLCTKRFVDDYNALPFLVSLSTMEYSNKGTFEKKRYQYDKMSAVEFAYLNKSVLACKQFFVTHLPTISCEAKLHTTDSTVTVDTSRIKRECDAMTSIYESSISPQPRVTDESVLTDLDARRVVLKIVDAAAFRSAADRANFFQHGKVVDIWHVEPASISECQIMEDEDSMAAAKNVRPGQLLNINDFTGNSSDTRISFLNSSMTLKCTGTSGSSLTLKSLRELMEPIVEITVQ